ncbi:nitrate reductase cytochrome c-type subunit [Motiliproteus sediminis]|uniref:nitrate reductase cytochrome c-type subunit n=1 Tax=Motiliproteus sediminis TaxID=1468178 RepID=UPI001FE62DE7|nr:nitrate reductase cytochrome c-type subunit [Motiliproteus sediminis]
MKTTTLAMTLAIATAGGIITPLAVGDIGGLESLRGLKNLDATNKAPHMAKYNESETLVERNYVQQPPVIPHEVRHYQVDLRSNKCLSCHSWESYKASGATKVSLTHFETRDGHALADISPRRYFCLQCHVPQAEVKPLIDNEYRSSSELGKP